MPPDIDLLGPHGRHGVRLHPSVNGNWTWGRLLLASGEGKRGKTTIISTASHEISGLEVEKIAGVRLILIPHWENALSPAVCRRNFFTGESLWG